MEEHVAKREKGRIHGVPVRVDDAGPMVRAEVVTDVHVGNGVAIELEGVVEGVPEGDGGGEQAVERKEAAQQRLE
jgi:hypothetical protein